MSKLNYIPRSQYVRIMALALMIAVSDQLSKAVIVENFAEGEGVAVIPDLFNLVLVYNKGAAFGMLGGLPDGIRQIALGITTIIAFGTITYLLFSEYVRDAKARWALGLIVGGAIGNIIDRVRLGQVVDFLDFYLGEYHWPAFNVADSAICIGVALLLLTSPKQAVE